MGLVFKLQQPVLLLAVDVDLDLDRAGVDLLGLIQILEQALLLEGFGADGGQVHQGHRLVLARVDGLAQLEIFVVGVPDVVALNLHVLDAGGEGGVAAVVGPVGIDHANLGDGWGALFGLFKVLLAEGDVAQVHRQAIVGDELLQALLVQIVKVFQHRNVRRNVERGVQRLHRLQRRLHRLDGVDQVFLDAGELLVAGAADDIDLCGGDGGAVVLGCQLDALHRRVGALVKLSRQKLHRKHLVLCAKGRQLVIDLIHLRLGKDGLFGQLKIFRGDVLDIVAVENPHPGHAANSQRAVDIRKDALRLNGEGGLLFYVHSVN